MNAKDGSENRFLGMINAQRKGRFKLYIGMSAGVGKTFRMLQEAHELRARGVDVRIGFVETHARAETEALVAGIPALPLHTLYFGNQEMKELDLDAVLLERPEVVLIDELPHTNAPGSQHTKRWQDVEFLLDAGLHVISAMNIQHLENLQKRISAISGVVVEELVPDRMIEQADELILVDLSPDDLIQRLRAGKVYPSGRVSYALAHFFQFETLMQLRELALQTVARHQAQHVREQLPQSRLARKSQVALCMSSNLRTGKALIRRVCQLSGSGWYALFIQTEPTTKVRAAEERALHALFEEVVQSGGSVIIWTGQPVAVTLLQCARELEIDLLVIGKTERSYWQRLRKGSLTEELIRLSRPLPLDILVVSTKSH